MLGKTKHSAVGEKNKRRRLHETLRVPAHLFPPQFCHFQAKFQESQSSLWYSRPWQTQTSGFWLGIFQRKVGRCKLERVFFWGGWFMMRDLEHNFFLSHQTVLDSVNFRFEGETRSLFQCNFLMDNGHKSSCYKSLGITFDIMKGIYKILLLS